MALRTARTSSSGSVSVRSFPKWFCSPLSPTIGHAVGAAEADSVDHLIDCATVFLPLARLDEVDVMLIQKVQLLDAATDDRRHRSYRPLFPQLGRAPVNQLALKSACRELAEVDLLAQLPTPMDVAVGLIDVKTTWVEPAELVAERLRTVLRYVDSARVSVTRDCGFSQTARHIAVATARAMVEGVKLVRQELKK
jgi:Cobalamin-independent synthase, Catalytic domain